MSSDVIFRTAGDLVAFWFLWVAFFTVGYGVFDSNFRSKKWGWRSRSSSTRVTEESPSSSSSFVNVRTTTTTPNGMSNTTRVPTMASITVYEDEYAEDDYSWYKSHVEMIPGYPPRWMFPVVWTILYILMCISFFLFVREIQYTPGFIMDVCGICITALIILNKMWTIVFFKHRAVRWALAMILVIMALTLVVMGLFGYHGDLWTSFALLIPYILWLCYALYLNAMWIHVEEKRRYVIVD